MKLDFSQKNEQRTLTARIYQVILDADQRYGGFTIKDISCLRGLIPRNIQSLLIRLRSSGILEKTDERRGDEGLVVFRVKDAEYLRKFISEH